MKMAKLQVIVRMVSPGLAAERMEIENTFPLDDARQRYLELIKQLFPVAQPLLASAPGDATDKPCCPSCEETLFGHWWPAIGEDESEEVACAGCGKPLLVTMVSDMKFSVREGGAE